MKQPNTTVRNSYTTAASISHTTKCSGFLVAGRSGGHTTPIKRVKGLGRTLSFVSTSSSIRNSLVLHKNGHKHSLFTKPPGERERERSRERGRERGRERHTERRERERERERGNKRDKKGMEKEKKRRRLGEKVKYEKEREGEHNDTKREREKKTSNPIRGEEALLGDSPSRAQEPGKETVQKAHPRSSAITHRPQE